MGITQFSCPWHTFGFDGPHLHFRLCLHSTTQAFEQRKCRADVLEQARQWEQQSRSIHPDRVHVWAGDWNAHVGSDHPDQHGRCVGLNTPTTPAGVEQRRWLSQTNLQAVDSRFRVANRGSRGTWHHPGTRKWCELDYFCCDERILRQVQSLRVHHLGFSDHAAKQMLFHLSKPGATGRKNRRAAKSSRIRQEAALASDIPRPLLYDALRGPSEGAKKNRGEIQRRVHLELAQRFPECVDNCPSSSSSASPAPATSGMSIFTDGSCEVSVQRQGRRKPAGWGIAIYNELTHEWQDYFGPVVYEKKHPAFLGATLGSNNTAELTALGQTVRFLLYGTNYRGPVTIHYDSVYAYKMATGQWRPRSNMQLIQTVQDLVTQVAGLRTVHWQHVYGHTGVTGDERADRNADRKSKGERCMWPRVRLHRRQEPGAQLSSAPTVQYQRLPLAPLPRCHGLSSLKFWLTLWRPLLGALNPTSWLPFTRTPTRTRFNV